MKALVKGISFKNLHEMLHEKELMLHDKEIWKTFLTFMILEYPSAFIRETMFSRLGSVMSFICGTGGKISNRLFR